MKDIFEFYHSGGTAPLGVQSGLITPDNGQGSRGAPEEDPEIGNYYGEIFGSMVD